MVRVFVDSSVLLAAALSTTGTAHDLVKLGTENRITLIISTLVLVEVERNLGRKASSRIPRFREILGSCPFEMVEPSAEIIASEVGKIEQKDVAIVAAAVTGSVHFLVTYDAKHLLAQAAQIEVRHGIVVCTPAMVIASIIDSG